MQAPVALVCFVIGMAAFFRFFYLVPRLRKERVRPPDGKLEEWFPWISGQFTPAGDRLRREMNRLMLLGWAFLIAGLVLSPR
jgi:hypothetical protein